MRSLIILMAFCVLSACSQNKISDATAAKACAKVTDLNWRNYIWNKDEASKQICEEQFKLLDEMLTTPDLAHPCTFGGKAYFCVVQRNGDVSILHPISRVPIEEIHGGDQARVAGHLVIL